MGVIYKISSPSGRLYIGQTRNLRKRINAYKCDIEKNMKDIKLHNSLRKYGWDAHVLEIVEEVADELLNEREIHWIAELKTYCYEYPKGLNMTRGGDGQCSTWMHNIERRKKQAERFTGEGNPFYGKHHTDDFKKKKAKQSSEYNKKHNITIPEWGVEKGRKAKRREIVCYDLNGVFVKEYSSLALASADLNMHHSSISDSLKNRRSQAKGYVFRYKADNYPLKIDVGVVKKQTVKRPIITVLSGKMWQHPSAKEASEFFGIPKTTINRAAMYNNGRPIRSGYTFYYKN